MSIFILLAWFITFALAQQSFEGCQNDFKPDQEKCAHFGFRSSVQEDHLCMEMTGNMDTYYDLKDLPQIKSVDPRVVKMASLVTNVFEYGDKRFGYAYVFIQVYRSCADIFPISVDVQISVTCADSLAVLLVLQ